MSIEKGKKEIEVVKGDGSDLNISPVYEHLINDSNNSNHDTKKEIVIPKGSNENKNDKK